MNTCRAVIVVAADGELVREVAHGHLRALAEHEARILVVPEMLAEVLLEIMTFLALAAEPGDGPIGEHAVQIIRRSIARSIVTRRRFRLSGSPMAA